MTNIPSNMIPYGTNIDPNSASESGMRFVADGTGGGSWIRTQGFGHYADDRLTEGAPAMDIATGVRTQFVCNGARLIREKLPSDATAPLWNVTTNKIMPIAAYDMMNVRMWFTAANYSGSIPYMFVELDLGGTDGVIFEQTIPLVKGGSPQAVQIAFPTYAGPDMVANGATFYVTYVGNANCDIYKNAIVINRESKNYV